MLSAPRVTSILGRLTVLVAVWLAIAICGGRGRAMNLPLYDVDSLIAMSDAIVEGDLREGGDVQVTAVYRGEIARGAVVLPGLGLYCRPAEALPELNTAPLATGSHLVLFLRKAKPTPGQEGPPSRPVFVTVWSGARVVLGGTVHGFVQRGNPGPYVLDMESHLTGGPVTIEAFRRDLLREITRVEGTIARLNAAATPADAPWLMDLLRERGALDAPSWKGWPRFSADYVAQLASKRLVDLHDPARLDEALQIPGVQRVGAWALRSGFGTPDGREYLLAAITDPARPVERKLSLLGALEGAGPVYEWRLDDSSSGGAHPAPAAGNHRYLTRLAGLVIRNRAHEDLCLALTQTLGRLIRPLDALSPIVRDDILGALAALKPAYDTSQSERLRYAIEVATVYGDRAAYDRLRSPCGPVLSLLTPADPSQYGGPKKGSLFFEYEIHRLDDAAYKAAVVLTSEESGRRYLLPPPPLRTDRDIGGANSVVLPAGLPHDTYRVRLQFTQNQRVVSVGHGFEVELQSRS